MRRTILYYMVLAYLLNLAPLALWVHVNILQLPHIHPYIHTYYMDLRWSKNNHFYLGYHKSNCEFVGEYMCRDFQFHMDHNATWNQDLGGPPTNQKTKRFRWT
jgi:hypothetical protein